MAGFAPEVLDLLHGLGVGCAPIGAGKVFFVDGRTGDDTHPGNDPAEPLLTIKAGISKCENWRNDYVIVLDYPTNHEAPYIMPTGEDWPIVVDKSRIHVIGLNGSGLIRPVPVLEAPALDTAVFQMQAEYGEIAGFFLGGGANHAAIEWLPAYTGMGRTLIRDCWFSWWEGGESQDGIKLSTAGFDYPNVEVHRCRFGAGISRDGIRCEGASTRSFFKENFFNVGGVGIHCLKGLYHAAILDNRFRGAHEAGVAIGWAITMGVGVGRALIDGNSAANSGEDPTKNPYLDLSTGAAATCLNAWERNYKGITATPPAYAE